MEALEVLTRSVAAKLLHDPIMFLKRNHHSRHAAAEITLVRRLFHLDPEEDHLQAPSRAESNDPGHCARAGKRLFLIKNRPP